MTRTPNDQCADCSRPMYIHRQQLIIATAHRCQPCRRANPTVPNPERGKKRAYDCAGCGEVFHAKEKNRRFCSRACFGKYQGVKQMVRSADDRRFKRSQRETNAPGLSKSQRTKLRDAWIRQGKTCAYCMNATATTIDHVLPLVRGGTNYEGNLTPACKSCNSSKGYRTIIEWRTGKRLPRMSAALPAKVRATKPSPLRACAICLMPSRNGTTCGPTCDEQRAARLVRNRYRQSMVENR